MPRVNFLRLASITLASVTLLVGSGALNVSPAAAATKSPHVTVSPSTGLKNGETVTVKGTGFKPTDSVYIVECLRTAKGQAQCAVTGIPIPVTISAKGVLPTTKFTVTTGTVGTGKCGTKPSNLKSCDVSVGNASGGDSATANITFK